MANDNYDESKDKTIKVLGRIESGRDQFVEVAIKSYNGGDAKVSVLRGGEREGSKWYSGRLGRLTSAEARTVGRLMRKAADFLEGGEEAEEPKAKMKVKLGMRKPKRFK